MNLHGYAKQPRNPHHEIEPKLFCLGHLNLQLERAALLPPLVACLAAPYHIAPRHD